MKRILYATLNTDNVSIVVVAIVTVAVKIIFIIFDAF